MRNADVAYLIALNGDIKAVDGMLEVILALCRYELGLGVKNVTAKLSCDISCTHKEAFLALGLGVEDNAELILLVALAILAKSLNGMANLEDSKGIRVALILLCKCKEGGNHSSAQDCVVGSLRVDNLNVVGSLDAELVALCLIRPDVRVNLVQTVALHENILHSVLVGLEDFLSHRDKGANRGAYIEVVVAVDTGDFLDNIRLDGDVLGGAPGGHDRGEAVTVEGDAEAERGESLNDSFVRNLNARVSVNVSLVEIKSDGGIVLNVAVGECRNYLCAIVAIHKNLEKSLGSHTAKLGVEHLLVSLRCIGTKSKTGGSLSYRNAVEGCRLKKKRGGVVLNLGRVAAHNACDCHRGVARGNHKHIFVNISLNSVESCKLEALGEGLNLDFINLCIVKCVHRLTELHHNVVGKVCKEVDSARTAVVKADSHIYRADLACNVLNLNSRVAIAKLALYLNLNLGKRCVCCGVNKLRALERSAGNGSELTRHTVVAPEVRTVGERLVINLEDYIVNIVGVLDVSTERDVVGNLPKARVIVGNAKLCLGAAHTVGGVACKLSGSDGDLTDVTADGSKSYAHSLSYVGSAANDVNNLVALVNLEKMKLLRVGVILNRENFCNDDAGEVRALFNYILYLSGRKCEVSDKRLFVQTGKVHEIAYPIHR